MANGEITQASPVRPGASGAAPAVAPAVLLVLNPSGQRSRVALEPLPFLIGRLADNHLVLRDNRASRNHARISVEGGAYVIEDLNSRHGTWVNGERVTRHALRNSDRIDFGVRDSYQLTFALDSGEIHRMMDRFGDSIASGRDDLSKLRHLVEVARAVQNSLSIQEVLAAVVDAALAVTNCERGFLLLRKDSTLDISVARDRQGRPLEPHALRVPTAVIQRALESRRDLLSMSFDPLEVSGVRPEMTVAQLELRSVVCLPLVRMRTGSEETRLTTASEATVGLLYLDSSKVQADLSSGNRELLQTLAMEASTILENARLIEEQRAKERIEAELKIAREIQQGLLPASLPTQGWFRAAGSSWPSAQVGGDYFDVRKIREDLWAAVVADVSGKGVSSALLAGFLQGAFLMAGGEEIEPMLSHLNAFLLERTRGEKYATVFYCTVSSSGALRYANAGHCAPFLVSREGRLRKLHTSGTPVGMLEQTSFQTVTLQLEPGDKIVIYSDGLTEAENAEGRFFESERLRVCLRDHAQRDAMSLHQVLMRTVDRFSEGGVMRDDVTALVLEFCG
jgi:sigma-B regulation protein RsbU (phosphoserine phosphatase)